jgi:tol-pal system protein YbgF
MSLSRTVLAFLVFAPLSFGANKEMQELQRDVAMLQDQIRTMQKEFGDRLVTMQTLTQTTLDAVNRTNNLVNVMENKFNDAMKQQQQSVSGPVMTVGTKLDQMAEDFRAVRESVLDMNTRMGKLDAKMADLQNMISTIRTPAAAPPPSSDGATSTQPAGGATSSPPPGLSAEALYSGAYRDMSTGKYDMALQEFTEYLKYFPTTQFASNAQFYLADIYYRKQDYNNALQAFDSVLERYPDGNKTADAHYMKGESFMKLGKNDAAAAEYRDVIKRYPDNDLAAKAKARLREMGLNVGTPTTSRSRRSR